MMYKRQKYLSRFGTILVTASSFTIILTFYLFFKNINHVMSIWGEVQKITVYLAPELSEVEQKQVHRDLEKIPQIENITYISSHQAITEFKSQVAGFLSDTKSDLNLQQIVPSYFEISVAPEKTLDVTIKKMNIIQNQIKSIKNVEDVSYGSVWVEQYSEILKQITGVALFIGLVLLVSSYFIVSNSIKTILYQRAKEIEVLEMIGATKSYIRKPFVAEGVFLTIFSFFPAFFIVGLSYLSLEKYFSTELKFLKMEKILIFFNVSEVFLFFVLFVLIGLFGSYLNISRFSWNSAR